MFNFVNQTTYNDEMKGNNSDHGDKQKDNAVKGGTEKRKCFSQNNGKGNDKEGDGDN